MFQGEKPFQCGHCSFRAAVRGNVNQHIRLRHGVDVPVLVIDTQQRQRRHVKDYDYAKLSGEFIQEVTDASPANRAVKVSSSAAAARREVKVTDASKVIPVNGHGQTAVTTDKDCASNALIN